MARIAWFLAWAFLSITVAHAANSSVPNLNPAAALTGSELLYCIQSSADTKCTSQAVADANAVNPLAGYNASGSITTTTGTISASSKSLVVASATGWSPGMGIAVANAGTGGNTELISSVTACGVTAAGVCGSTTFTLNDAAVTTATGQTVNHDDTAAISAAITAAMSANKPLHLQAGSYNVTSGLTAISSPITLYGDGALASIIQNRSKTANVFTINYQQNIVTGPPALLTVAALIRDFSIQQASGIVPTAGTAFTIASQSGGNFYVTGLVISNILCNGTYACITTGTGIISNWFLNIHIWNTIGGWGIDYNTVEPGGDNHWNDIEMSGANTGLRITKSDTQNFQNLKTNGSGVLFNGAATADINRVRFINPSIEGNGTLPSCGFDFGSNGATQITIVGGEIAGIPTPICNPANVAGGLSILGVLKANAVFASPSPLHLMTGLPTSCTSQLSGTLWNNSGVLSICP